MQRKEAGTGKAESKHEGTVRDTRKRQEEMTKRKKVERGIHFVWSNRLTDI